MSSKETSVDDVIWELTWLHEVHLLFHQTSYFVDNIQHGVLRGIFMALEVAKSARQHPQATAQQPEASVFVALATCHTALVRLETACKWIESLPTNTEQDQADSQLAIASCERLMARFGSLLTSLESHLAVRQPVEGNSTGQEGTS